ncbi:hypothetical protein KQX54_019226 [Cotesia glomerata]|uniref:Uncharacterized protein n=1 Tax=Cotesia glomerata TaxID=32391 RepID=A0AAV7HZB5_COTGL|nr:hypothetical protein KQX54_019226 [Cotesia glomerata]
MVLMQLRVVCCRGDDARGTGTGAGAGETAALLAEQVVPAGKTGMTSVQGRWQGYRTSRHKRVRMKIRGDGVQASFQGVHVLVLAEFRFFPGASNKIFILTPGVIISAGKWPENGRLSRYRFPQTFSSAAQLLIPMLIFYKTKFTRILISRCTCLPPQLDSLIKTSSLLSLSSFLNSSQTEQ